MKISSIINALETWAPPALQEGYDNSGLLVGHPEQTAQKALISLDLTEAVLEEAITTGCNLIISHHPVIFKGFKRLNGKSEQERIIIKAIKNDIAIYAIHTNLDNVYTGVNAKIAEKLGIATPQILAPKAEILEKLVTFCPLGENEQQETYTDLVRKAIFEAGAGKIGDYDCCSFHQEGKGSFRPGENTNAFVGKKGEIHFEKEARIEVIYPAYLRQAILANLKKAHPYEEVAYDVYPLKNQHPQVGSGMYGMLEKPIPWKNFLQQVKDNFQLSIIRHTPSVKDHVERIAFCGGSGIFLLPQAKAIKADVFLTGDVKYHDFFEHQNQLMIADIGHFESEQFTIDLIFERLSKIFSNFAFLKTSINTNSINYFL